LAGLGLQSWKRRKGVSGIGLGRLGKLQHRKGGMRMWLAPVLLAAMASADTAKDAEKAFQEMSTALTQATSFACAFEIKVESPEGKGSFKGRLVVAQGNKVRIEMDGEGGGKTTSLLSVSDGTKTVAVANKTTQPARDTPKNMTQAVLTGTARGGLFVPSFLA